MDLQAPHFFFDMNHYSRQNCLHGRTCMTDMDISYLSFMYRSCIFPGHLQSPDNPVCFVSEILAGLRHLNALFIAIKKPGPYLLFQLLDLAGQCWLCKRDLLCCLSKVQMLTKQQEVFELTCIHSLIVKLYQ